MSKVSMVGKMTCAEGQNGALEVALAGMTAAAAGEPGMEIYSYHRGQGNEYWFFALMSNQEAMEAHGQSDAMKAAMGAAFAVIEGRPEMSPTVPVAAYGFDMA